ncbi:uncharacterized protein MONOS_7357 [Monocercomonoides exilis]|uniref:uncharacterized protein n=1 Tax=Monocercomonoides exilis TaxID=2049356 RepID=UPI003559FA7D|nr:hypothetical protein MONOS_7357 [Monocercomonoides exilis]|eukprot:MONOS_7357.1-p1 / transcript=MONOS_7357.1 / gene=MONOS_7357 / organism=Monocercomonoides_exilis_PA203 / gene_product=unspecified product / transcript_product=unspecified product / location=Mono_scaffold00249:51961-53079(-) / protein_length=373 / sequence_SO=supercontig / SO=protein_coding / is_pseudo=false
MVVQMGTILPTAQNAYSVGNASNNSNSSSSSSSSTSSSASASASSLLLPTRKQSNPLNSTPQSKGSNPYQLLQPEVCPQLTPFSLPSDDLTLSSSTSVYTTNTTLSVSSTSSTSSSVSSSSSFPSSAIKTIEVYSNNLRKRLQSQLLQQSHLGRITPQNNNSLDLSRSFNASVKEDGYGMLEAKTEIDSMQAEDRKNNQSTQVSHISSKTNSSSKESVQMKHLNFKENSSGSLMNTQQLDQNQQQQLSQADGSPRFQTPRFFAQSQVPFSLPQNSADDTMANSPLSPPPFVSLAFPPSSSATLSASSSSFSLSSSSSSPPLSLSSSSIPSASFTSPSRHKSSNSTDQSMLFLSKLSSSQTSSASNTQLQSPR